MKKLEGKTVLITGAARGIGASAARMCAQEGARLMLVDMLEEPLLALAKDLGEVAMLNAGISGALHSLDEYPTELLDQVMGVNARGIRASGPLDANTPVPPPPPPDLVANHHPANALP